MSLCELNHNLKRGSTLLFILLKNFNYYRQKFVGQTFVFQNNIGILNWREERSDGLQSGNFDLSCAVLQSISEKGQEVVWILDDQILGEMILSQYFKVVKGKALPFWFSLWSWARFAHKLDKIWDQFRVLVIELTIAFWDNVSASFQK